MEEILLFNTIVTVCQDVSGIKKNKEQGRDLTIYSSFNIYIYVCIYISNCLGAITYDVLNKTKQKHLL